MFILKRVLILETTALKLGGDDMSMRSVIRAMWLEFQQSIGIRNKWTSQPMRYVKNQTNNYL